MPGLSEKSCDPPTGDLTYNELLTLSPWRLVLRYVYLRTSRLTSLQETPILIETVLIWMPPGHAELLMLMWAR